ncbi:hypothetical protein AI27_05080 [Sphingomonas sp. BHC-A]|nr:hypothetical protein AI27_05080 [Sphingomonas sp. BHC-A]
MTKQKVDGADAQEKSLDDVAAIIALLNGPEAVEVIGGVVVAKLGEILPPILDAKLRELLPSIIVEFGTEIAVVVSQHADADLAVSGPSIEELLEQIKPQLPDLIAELVPSVRAEREAEAAREQTAQDASNARKEQAKREGAAEKAAKRAADERVGKIAKAREAFAKLFGPDAEAVQFAVSDDGKVGLTVDDGKAFCIDFVKEIDASKLVQQDGLLRLAEKIELPADIPGFVVRGVSISDGAYGAIRCEIPTPLHIGEGRSACLAADSLVFRAPVVAPVETDAASA